MRLVRDQRSGARDRAGGSSRSACSPVAPLRNHRPSQGIAGGPASDAKKSRSTPAGCASSGRGRRRWTPDGQRAPRPARPLAAKATFPGARHRRCIFISTSTSGATSSGPVMQRSRVSLPNGCSKRRPTAPARPRSVRRQRQARPSVQSRSTSSRSSLRARRKDQRSPGEDDPVQPSRPRSPTARVMPDPEGTRAAGPSRRADRHFQAGRAGRGDPSTVKVAAL